LGQLPFHRKTGVLLFSILFGIAFDDASRLRAQDSVSAEVPSEGTPSEETPSAYLQKIPGTAHSIRMVPIPAREGKPGYWLSATEIPWEVFDLFIFGIDGARDREGDSVDAYTRPSKPYIPPDRGFGHDGYPVISASYRNAKQFCRWLSAKTSNSYRLPTVDEWRYAAAAGSEGKWCFGDDESQLGDYSWFDENASWTTHPVGQKKPNGWGLYDVHGNAGEWCVEVGEDGKRRVVLCGGNFQGRAGEITLSSIERPEESWQMSDPQIPKSRWWLSDAPFAGLRILRLFPEKSEDSSSAEKGEKSKGSEAAPKGDEAERQKEDR